jgi:hypothetical protein
MKKNLGVVLLIVILNLAVIFVWICSISPSVSFGHHPLEKLFSHLGFYLAVIYFAVYPALFVLEACFNKPTWYFRDTYYSWLSELLMTFVEFFNSLTGLVKQGLTLLKPISTTIERP